MALPGVLSALRELILDEGALPVSAEERFAYFRTRFPALTDPEREDLAKMPPDKLAIYTTSIFVGERNVLAAKYPISFALLGRFFPLVYGRPFDSRAFVRELHAARPWRGNRTEELVANFRVFVESDTRELVDRAPIIADALCIEHLSFLVSRADGTFSREGALAPEDLARIAVGELLGCGAMMPPWVSFQRFGCDMVGLYAGFHTNDETLPAELPGRSETYAVGARNARGFARWTALPEGGWRAMEKLPRGERVELSELAAALTVGESAESDEQLFAEFFARLTALMKAGALVVRR